jgi:chemotaxis protein histidine kinase CheA
VKLGLIAEGTELTTERSLRLIFRPGFSTSTEISSVSGRGVGLDIVEKEIERVGGNVRVRTRVGTGTEFEIRLPAALGVMRALVLHSGSNCYCVDSSSIIDQAPMIEAVDVAENFRWENQDVPLVHLQSLLNAESREESQVLICEFSSGEAPAWTKRRAVAVQSIEGVQEVLVRSLGRHSAMWPGVVGATELWDGTVALVLDLPLLLANR